MLVSSSLAGVWASHFFVLVVTSDTPSYAWLNLLVVFPGGFYLIQFHFFSSLFPCAVFLPWWSLFIFIANLTRSSVLLIFFSNPGLNYWLICILWGHWSCLLVNFTTFIQCLPASVFCRSHVEGQYSVGVMSYCLCSVMQFACHLLWDLTEQPVHKGSVLRTTIWWNKLL